MLKLYPSTGFVSFLTLVLAACLAAVNDVAATTRTVSSLADNGAGTLRDTIVASAANDAIIFSIGGTIVLTSGQIGIGRNLTITGPATGIEIFGNGSNRVFNIIAGTVNISKLTISGGLAVGTPGLPPTVASGDGDGGGILNLGTLNLDSCLLRNNIAKGGSGGPSDIGGCNCDPGFIGGKGRGGGLANHGQVNATNCTFYNNLALGGTAGTVGHESYGACGPGIGGGIFNDGALILVNCAVAQNTAQGPNASASQDNSPSGGSAFGGGVFEGGDGAYRNVIIANNTVVAGKGNSGGDIGYGANGIALYPDVDGSVTSQGHNLIGKTDGSSGWVASDLLGTIAAPLNPQLGSTDYNGGPTPTLALLAASPAIDAGDDAVLSAPYNLTTDQRGFPRPGGSHVDIGPFEFGGKTLVVTTLNDTGPGSLRQSILSASAGDRIIFTPLVTGTISLMAELLITQPLNIVGPGTTNLTVSANQLSRVMHVNANGGLTLNGLTLADGAINVSAGTSGSTGGGAFGGVFLNEGISSLTDCVITNGSAIGGTGGNGVFLGVGAAAGGEGGGGGIYNTGQLSLLRCDLSGNLVQGGLGGTGAAGSTSGGIGGPAVGAGFGNVGTAVLTNCTLASNVATGGHGGRGGHNNSGFGGTGGLGGTAHGAGYSSELGSTSFGSCTLSSNQSIAGGGGFGGAGSSGNGGSFGQGDANGGGLYVAGTVQLQNSIIANNLATTYPDVNGPIQSGGFNLIGISDGSSGWLAGEAGNLGNASFPLDPKLGPLQNNGGPTPTMALLPGSPAIDRGNSFGLTTDQRGFARLYDNGSIANSSGGDGSDIGAFELSPAVVLRPVLNIALQLNKTVLSWSTNSAGFTLESSPQVSPGAWSAVTNVPGIADGQYLVTNSPISTYRLFRLRYP